MTTLSNLETTIKKLFNNNDIEQVSNYINHYNYVNHYKSLKLSDIHTCIDKLIENKELIKTTHGRYYSIENLIDEVLYVINNQIADRDFFCIVLSAHLSIDIEVIEEIIKDMINDQTLIIMPGNAKKNGGYYEHSIYGIA